MQMGRQNRSGNPVILKERLLHTEREKKGKEKRKKERKKHPQNQQKHNKNKKKNKKQKN